MAVSYAAKSKQSKAINRFAEDDDDDDDSRVKWQDIRGGGLYGRTGAEMNTRVWGLQAVQHLLFERHYTAAAYRLYIVYTSADERKQHVELSADKSDQVFTAAQ